MVSVQGDAKHQKDRGRELREGDENDSGDWATGVLRAWQVTQEGKNGNSYDGPTYVAL